MLTEKPNYKLTDPMFISTRLMPAVRIGGGILSAEAHAVETNGRAHFRFHLDVPGVGEWRSEDSYVTVMSPTWTHAAASALETFTDAASIDHLADNRVVDDLPETVKVWVIENALDFFDMSERLREWIDDNPQ